MKGTYMDLVDKKIIELLKEDSKKNFKSIGKITHMTGQAVGNRVRKLEEEGIIEGYTIRVNTQKQGCISAYIMVFMKSNDHYRMKQFIKEKKEIAEAMRISGECCYLLKAEANSHEALNELCDQILKFANYKINIVTEKIL